MSKKTLFLISDQKAFGLQILERSYCAIEESLSKGITMKMICAILHTSRKWPLVADQRIGHKAFALSPKVCLEHIRSVQVNLLWILWTLKTRKFDNSGRSSMGPLCNSLPNELPLNSSRPCSANSNLINSVFKFCKIFRLPLFEVGKKRILFLF